MNIHVEKELSQFDWLNLWSCMKIHNKYVREVLALKLMLLMNMINQVVWNSTIWTTDAYLIKGDPKIV